MTTLVVAPEALEGNEWRISGGAHHHLFRVKRLAAGDRLRLVDGAGRARFAEVSTISKSEAVARLGGEAPANEPVLAVELCVAPPKPERAAWLVEKATEVGVIAVRFFAAGRAARALAPGQLDRLRRVAVAAVEQCGRARVPEIALEPSLDRALDERAARSRLVVLDSAGGAPLSGPVARGGVTVLIGPEGGFTDAERARFAQAGATVWSLGERVLRVETAAVVAAGILLTPPDRAAGGLG